MPRTIRTICTNRLLSFFRGRKPSRVNRRHLTIQQLEDRSVPAVYTVNGLTDTGTADPGDPLKGDLRYCVGQANASVGVADTINFDNATTGGQTITLAGTELLVTDAVTINGPTLIGPANPNVTISGNGVSRIFNLNQGAGVVTFTISNLRLTTASGASYGGAITLQSVEDNLTVTDCSFESNKTGNFGGAIGAPANATVATLGTVNITRSKFLSNVNAFNFGGAVAFDCSTAPVPTSGWKVSITDSTFDSNVASSNGNDCGCFDVQLKAEISGHATVDFERDIYKESIGCSGSIRDRGSNRELSLRDNHIIQR